jgi:hypothetical protein
MAELDQCGEQGIYIIIYMYFQVTEKSLHITFAVTNPLYFT